MFCLGDISAFCQKLESSKIILDKTIIYRALCFKSRALWNAGKYSKSLTTVAVASEFWLGHLDTSNRYIVKARLFRHIVYKIETKILDSLTGKIIHMFTISLVTFVLTCILHVLTLYMSPVSSIFHIVLIVNS